MPFVSVHTIADYYNTNQVLYNLLWSEKSLHFGLWYSDTKSHRQSIDNMNIFIGSAMNLERNDHVLDAGCGVGGTAIYLADRFGVKVSGITVSDVQVKQANRHIEKNKNIKHLVNFENRNFTATGYNHESFNKIYAVGSSCYANDKNEFVTEMYRLLRPGGKLLVIEAFIKDIKSGKDQKMLNRFYRGWAVPDLVTTHEFHSILCNAGFKNIQCGDETGKIIRSSAVSWKLGMVFYPFSWMGSLLKIIPENMHSHCISCILQKYLFDNGVMKYVSFAAEK